MRAKAAQTPAGAGEGGVVRRKRMDYLTRALVIRLREAENPLSYAEIAQRLDISESSARRIGQWDAADRKAAIKRVMQSGDMERLDEWAKASRISAKRGYFQAAQAWLQASDAIDAKPTSSVTVDARPTFVLSVPYTLGALKDYQPPEAPAIDAEAVPAALPAKEQP